MMVDGTAMLRDGTIAVSLYSDVVTVLANKTYVLRVRGKEETFTLDYNQERDILGIIVNSRSRPMFSTK